MATAGSLFEGDPNEELAALLQAEAEEQLALGSAALDPRLMDLARCVMSGDLGEDDPIQVGMLSGSIFGIFVDVICAEYGLGSHAAEEAFLQAKVKVRQEKVKAGTESYYQ